MAFSVFCRIEDIEDDKMKNNRKANSSTGNVKGARGVFSAGLPASALILAFKKKEKKKSFSE